jgi:hypothetical protein
MQADIFSQISDSDEHFESGRHGRIGTKFRRSGGAARMEPFGSMRVNIFRSG